MEEGIKNVLIKAVIQSPFKTVKDYLQKYKLVKDESFFDYDLLIAALQRNHVTIIQLLLKLGCRVNNPTKKSSECSGTMHLAIKLKNINIIQKLCEAGATINIQDIRNETPLLKAFLEGEYNILDFILNNYCFNNINSANDDEEMQYKHFHIACIRHNCRVVTHFLKRGFDPNRPLSLDSDDYSGLNPVHYAVSKKYFDMYKILLRYGADLSIQNKDAQTPVHLIFYFEYLNGQGTEMLLKTFDLGNLTLHINCRDNNGVSHLHLCCLTDYEDHVKEYILMDKEHVHEDINSIVSLSSPVYPGFTPLHFAVMHSRENVVKTLLKHGADCNKADKEGVTPLHLACIVLGRVGKSVIKRSIIEILLEYKASAIAADTRGRTPIHSTFYSNNFNFFKEATIIDMLFSNITELTNVTDDQNLSLFHIVCLINNLSRVKYFLESKVAVDSSVTSGKYNGYTALHFAAMYNRKEVVEELLHWNAQVNIKIRELHLTPLHLACLFNQEKFSELYLRYEDGSKWLTRDSEERDWTSNQDNQLEIIQLLLRHKAEIDAKDSSGRTPLFYACIINDNYCDNNWNFIFKRTLIGKIRITSKRIAETLLLNNADINVEDEFGSSSISYLTKWEFKEIESVHTFQLQAGVFKAFFFHVKNLLNSKFDVNKKIQNCCINLRQRYNDVYKNLKRKMSENSNKVGPAAKLPKKE